MIVGRQFIAWNATEKADPSRTGRRDGLFSAICVLTTAGRSVNQTTNLSNLLGPSSPGGALTIGIPAS
jgi:hypothetical protein